MQDNIQWIKYASIGLTSSDFMRRCRRPHENAEALIRLLPAETSEP
jgi:hypothetical protein